MVQGGGIVSAMAGAALTAFGVPFSPHTHCRAHCNFEVVEIGAEEREKDI